MNCNSYISTLLFFILINLIIGPLPIKINAQNIKKFNKYLVKAESSFEKNKFEKAIKFTNKLEANSTDKLGSSNRFVAVARIKRAKYNWAIGKLGNFYELNESALIISEQVNGSSSIGHALNLKDVAQNMIYYGNYLQAKNYLEKAIPIFNKTQEANEIYRADIELSMADILLNIGEYNKALALIKSNETNLLQKALNQKSQNLSKSEAEQYLQFVAKLITLKSNALRFQGNFISADSAFIHGENWIKTKLGKKSPEFSEHLFYFAQMLEENGAHELPAYYYSDAYVYSLSALGDLHPYTLRNLEHLIRYSIKEGENNKAVTYYKDLEKILTTNFDKNSTHYVKLAIVSFEADLRKGKISKTASSAKKLLSDASFLPTDHPYRVELYDILIQLAAAKNNYAVIESYIQAKKETNAKLYGEPSIATALNQIELANFYVDHTDNFSKADELYQEYFYNFLESQILSGHPQYVNIINHLAKKHQYNDNYKLASELLDKALLITRVKYDNLDVNFGKELTLIADLQIKIGEYDKAEKNISEAIKILADFDNEIDLIYQVKALETFAKLRSIKGFYDEAEDAIEKAQNLYINAIPSPDYNPLIAAQELASVYLKIGEYVQAEEILAAAIRNNKILYGDGSQKLILPLVDYGKLQLFKGDYTEVEKNARTALDISQKVFGNKSTKNSPAIMLLGELYETLGDFEKAEEFYSNGINILESQFGRTHVDVAMAISRLAIAKFRGGDTDNATIEEMLFEAKDIIGKQFTVLSPLYAEILKDLSVFFISENKLEDAIGFLDQSEKIWLNKAGRRNNIKAADIHILRGDVYYRQFKYRDAEKEYKSSQKLNERFFNDNHPEYVKATARLSKVYYMDGDYKKAKENIEEVIQKYGGFIEDYFPALSEREKTKYWNTIRGDYDFYNTMALKLYDDYPEMIETIYNNTLKTKGLLLSSSIKMRQRIINSPDSLLKKQYFNWLEKKELLAKAISMNEEQMNAIGLNLSSLAKDVEAIEKELSSKSELFNKGIEQEDFTFEDVKVKLKENEIAIEMVRFRHFDRFLTDSIIYVMLILKNEKKSKPTYIVLNNGNDLESKYFNNYRNSIKYRITDKYSYQQYWEPIEKAVGKNATIYLSPDGVFNQINLEAIPTGGDNYLIDNSNIILVNNTKDLITVQRDSSFSNSPKRALLFGDPKFYLASKSDYTADFKSGAAQVNDLPGTRVEVEALTTLFKSFGWATEDYLSLEAGENNVKDMQSPSVFHIATHGFFSEDAASQNTSDRTITEASVGNNPLLKSGLMLKGAGDVLAKTKYNYNLEPGILTAYEAMNLNLDKTDLVVLSACETGLGVVQSGEGVYGLQRSFQVAGAKTLIMSLFKVSDEATQKLMISFYKKWLETGNKRQAFVDAKKELRNEYRDPIYWGAFIMIGLD
ncbi:MAG: CHAT domain-containing protein [Marivirga sp.]|jgi:CHAT domain-containing protein